MRILHVVGARPNFMKAAAVIRACGQHPQLTQLLVHTGQHYDSNMSDVFFRELGIPEPDINLQVGSGSHAQQTAAIISRFESVVADQQPDLVLVYGDVNSTVACALVCAKLLVSVAHVEAGLRSFDRTMPEEVNRLLTDQISDLLFTPSSDADENLLREGIPLTWTIRAFYANSWTCFARSPTVCPCFFLSIPAPVNASQTSGWRKCGIATCA
jgi:UDP-N-acetylglucosamine 2-epimerase (non-hydrolysing)